MDPVLSEHEPWVENLKTQYCFTPNNSGAIFREEVGQVFFRVPEHAGVYKHTNEGRKALMQFIDAVNQ